MKKDIKACEFPEDEVFINKIGSADILLPREKQWAGLLAGLNIFTSDFMREGRFQDVTQEREEL